jgi:N-acyl-D-aspartate/D-glutamate deacylase
MNAAQKRGVGLNVGFMAPLTPFRHFVMGEESMERAATKEETVKIAALLREAFAAGAMGLSTTNGPQHIGYQGRPLACRLSSREELTAYCNVLRDMGRGVIELALNDAPSYVSESDYELLNLLLTESNRPVTWLALLNRAVNTFTGTGFSRRLENPH